jgi:hypothetical protein
VVQEKAVDAMDLSRTREEVSTGGLLWRGVWEWWRQRGEAAWG